MIEAHGLVKRYGSTTAVDDLNPAVLIFDEPVNGLDPDGIHWVRTLIQALAAACGIALSELTPIRASLEEAFMELTRDSVEYQAAGATR